MYCTNCGKELNGGEFCTNCGKKVEPSSDNQITNFSSTTNSYVPKKPINNKNRNIVFSVVGGAAVLLIVILAFGHGKADDRNTIPYYSEPYSGTQGVVPPPADYSDGYSGYSDYDTYDSNDTYDSYDYGNSTQTCPSCYGSGTCPICSGTGQYSMYGNDYSECTACGGTGICSVCGGSGVF